jgi:hypothetical protein
MRRIFLIFISIWFTMALHAQNTDSSNRVLYERTLVTPNVVPPTVTVSKVTTPHYFVIGLLKSKISAEFKNKMLGISTVKQLDAYLKGHIENLDKSRFELKGSSDTSSDEFKAVLEVLKKYQITKFEFVTVK